MKKKTKKILEWVIFSVLGLAILLSSLLLYYQNAYAGRIYRNVHVENIDLSGKSKTQAKFLIQKFYDSISSQEVVLKSEDKEVKTTLADTGFAIDIDQVVNNCYKVGRNQNFLDQLYVLSKSIVVDEEVSLTPVVNDDKYKEFLAIAVAQLEEQPQDASIAIQDGVVVETKEKNGKSIETNNLVQEIISYYASHNTGALLLSSITMPSSVKAADFTDAKNYANDILSRQITFTYQSNNFTPTRSEIGLWINFENKDGRITASLNETNMMAYLNKISKSFEITRKDRKINGLTNEVIEEGQEGLYIDKNLAVSQIKSHINSENKFSIILTTYTEAPKEVRVIPAEGLIPGRFEGRYLDVDLTTQQLCRIESTAIIDCFAISSGKPGMPTPTGTFSIRNKSPRQYSSKYGMWMPWWEEFSGSYGIHELPETATWKEIPDHLGTPVSHGCVRLGVGPAQTVYDWTVIGTPVYIHK